MNQNPDDLRTAGLHRGPNHIDYRETEDLTNVHAAVQRGAFRGDAGPGADAVLAHGFCGVAIFWAGTSFSGGFGGSYFSADNYSVHPAAEARGGRDAAGGPARQGRRRRNWGKTCFTQNCVVCHQANGAGIPNTYPPLAGSEYVNGGSKRLGMILLKGLQGSMTVEGRQFERRNARRGARR